MQHSQFPIRFRFSMQRKAPNARGDDRMRGQEEIALGFECADPARQIEGWEGEAAPRPVQERTY